MGENWFVRPEVVRLAVTDKVWIEVKKRLTTGEMRDAAQAAAGMVDLQGIWRPNLAMAGITQNVSYLLDWNLVDDNDKPVVIDTDAKKLAALRGLPEDKYDLIETAISEHIDRVAAEDAELKKTKGGETHSGATTPSAA